MRSLMMICGLAALVAVGCGEVSLTDAPLTDADLTSVSSECALCDGECSCDKAGKCTKCEGECTCHKDDAAPGEAGHAEDGHDHAEGEHDEAGHNHDAADHDAGAES